MKKMLFGAALIFCTLPGFAQADSTSNSRQDKRIDFQSAVLVGVLEGETVPSFQGQIMGGMAWRSWFAGMGAGIDYYFFRSIPVFIDVRKNIFNGRKTPFVYAEGGINFPWVKKQMETFGYTFDYKNGWYYDVGAGFNLQTAKAGTYFISLGFSEKSYAENTSYPLYDDIIYRYSGPVMNRFKYQLRRLSLKGGVRF